MSVFGSLKKIGQKGIDRVKERIEKVALLRKYRKSDLINFCKEWEITYSKDMDKDELVNTVLADKVATLSNIQAYYDSSKKRKSTRKKIIVDEDVEIEQEIIRTEKIKTKVKKRTATLTQLRLKIKNFSPITPRKKSIKERDVEAQMVQSLQAIFGKNKVNYQERSRGGRVDIVVDGKYAIELKVNISASQLNSLLGQAMVYSEDYEKVFVYIFDQRRQLKTVDINKFKKRFKSANVKNVEVIVKK